MMLVVCAAAGQDTEKNRKATTAQRKIFFMGWVNNKND
jgi:hypothetical protein